MEYQYFIQLYPWESLHIYFYYLHKKSEELFWQCFWFTQFWWAKTHRFTHSIIELGIFSRCMWSCLIYEFIEWYTMKQILLKKNIDLFHGVIIVSWKNHLPMRLTTSGKRKCIFFIKLIYVSLRAMLGT